jgi:hypothetical protein
MRALPGAKDAVYMSNEPLREKIHELEGRDEKAGQFIREDTKALELKEGTFISSMINRREVRELRE